MADFQITMKDNNTTAILVRPFAIVPAVGVPVIEMEVLKLWLAGSRGAMDPADPRKVTVTGLTGEWVFVVGGPISREYDSENDLTYDFSGPMRSDVAAQDISWAYYSGALAFEAALAQAKIENPPYANVKRDEWFTSNPLSNDEAWVEVPVTIDPIPPLV